MKSHLPSSTSSRRYTAMLLLAGVVLASCAIERIDFPAYLQRSVGSPIAATEYDSMVAPVGGRRVLSESAGKVVYSYQPPGSSCAWTVTVDKTTTVVLGWSFLSPQAEAACRDLPARRGV
jgi:hypothetical protein